MSARPKSRAPFVPSDDISQEIASALNVKLARAKADPQTKESFEQAQVSIPLYAQAHTGLAIFYYSIGALSIRRISEVGPLARASTEKALAIDRDLSEAHSVLSLLAGAVQYAWKAAGLHFQSAMAVDPVPPLVQSRYALYLLLPLKRYNEAVVQYLGALETDSLSTMGPLRTFLRPLTAIAATTRPSSTPPKRWISADGQWRGGDAADTDVRRYFERAERNSEQQRQLFRAGVGDAFQCSGREPGAG